MRHNKEVLLAALGGVVLGVASAGSLLLPLSAWKTLYGVMPIIAWEVKAFEALSALGTCGAVVAALWLAQAKTRQDGKDELLKAQLCAAKLSIRLREAATSMDNVVSLLSFRHSIPKNKATQIELHRDLIRLAQREYFEPSTEDLTALIPLPDSCAHRIARSYDIFGQFSRSVQGSDLADWFESASVDARERMLNRWHQQLTEAAGLLLVASEACQVAAHLGAPPASTEELLNIYVR